MSKNNGIDSQDAHEEILDGSKLTCCFCDDEVKDKDFCIEHNNKLLCLDCVAAVGKLVTEEYEKEVEKLNQNKEKN